MNEIGVIGAMPKIELHMHLDGCVLPATLVELAREQRKPLPAGETAGLLPYMQAGDDCASLTEYLAKFDFVLPFLQNGEALERIACEAVEQAAGHNVLYLEVRFAPLLHTREGLTAEAALRHALTGLRRAESASGVKARCIAICMRHHDADTNRRVVEAAARFAGEGLVAVDLAGDEAGFPPGKFRAVFAEAARRGLPATIHAGEAAGAANVREAIERLGAVRIGHGVRAREDAAVMRLLEERAIPLELCPVSNIQTKAVASWDDYPIRDYFDRGLAVTVNTDNPTVSGTTLTREYEELQARFGFTTAELARIALNGIDAAFLAEAEKRALRQEALRRFDELGVAPAEGR